MLLNLPYKVLVEKNVDEKIEQLLLDLNLGNNVALICDESVKKLIAGKIKNRLKKIHADIVIANSLQQNELKEFSKRMEKYDFLIGIGGGRSIDIAKYSAFLAGKEWVSFPTILSHDGIISSRASISAGDEAKISVDAKDPIAIIVDIETIKAAPYRWLAAGAGDLISNYSAIEDWRIADKAGKEKYHNLIAKLSLLAADAVTEHMKEISEKDYHGIEILLWSLLCSGFAMNIAGSSRPCSGSEHNFSHSLDSLKAGALHGEQCALGTIISYYLQGNDWEKIQGYMKKLKLPTDAKQIGIEKKILIKALVNARNVRGRYTILNEVSIDEKKAEEILKKVEII